MGFVSKKKLGVRWASWTGENGWLITTVEKKISPKCSAVLTRNGLWKKMRARRRGGKKSSSQILKGYFDEKLRRSSRTQEATVCAKEKKNS